MKSRVETEGVPRWQKGRGGGEEERFAEEGRMRGGVDT